MLDLFTIRKELEKGKKLIDLPLYVTYYARVSTDRDEQLNSLENQILYFENYIKSITNWTFIPGYIDEGISGTSTKRRTSFLKMIRDAKNNKFNLILTKEISRFSRNTLDSIKYSQELLSLGIGIYFLNDNICTFDGDSELRLTIMASIAQDEIRKLSERIRFGYQRSVEKGVVPGNNNFYGYRKNKGKLEIVEEEASLIRLIFKEYAKAQMGTTKLGHYLFSKYNIVSKTNKPLAGNVIGRIIRNPKYKGYFCAHKETTLDYHSKKRIKLKKEDWIVYKDNLTCPPIISEDLWDRCNHILDENTARYETKKRTDMRYALSGKIKCYNDGATFIKGSYKNKKTGVIKKYWGCSNYRKYGKLKNNGCNSPILHYEDLLNIFKMIVKSFIKEEKDLFSDIYTLIKQQEKDLKEDDELNKRIEKLQDMNLELINMRAKKEIDSDEFLERKKRYREEITNLQKQKKKEKDNFLDEMDLDDFKNKIETILFSDDETIFRIFISLVDSILVERLESASHGMKLHFILNITSCSDTSFSLKEFLLLFSNG